MSQIWRSSVEMTEYFGGRRASHENTRNNSSQNIACTEPSYVELHDSSTGVTKRTSGVEMDVPGPCVNIYSGRIITALDYHLSD
jgi:hypothetical protein